MDNPKKTLILYASAGHGHEQAAKAILDVYKESGNPEHAEAIDALKVIPPFWGRLYKEIYYSQIRYTPWLWGIFYYCMDIPWIYSLVRLARRFINSTAGGPLAKLIRDENPTVIISTHFLPTEIAGCLQQKGLIHSKLVTVVTDYLPHYFWTAQGAGFYAVGLDETKAGLIKRGVLAEKIKVLGIPVEKKFLTPHSRDAVCEKLGLRKNVFTVLVTSGGAAIGSVRKMVEDILALKKPIQILAVCGTNKKLFDALEPYAAGNRLLKVFQFVTNMDELMEASDLVIGKAGGLTITESFVKGKPVILFKSIPGQERRNASCVRKYGAGVVADSLEEAVSSVSELLDSPEKLQAMRDNVRRIARPEAAQKIVEFAEHGS